MPYHDPDRPYVNPGSPRPRAPTSRSSTASSPKGTGPPGGGRRVHHVHAPGERLRPRRAARRPVRRPHARLAAKNGWFVPVSTLLDFLASSVGDAPTPPRERRPGAPLAAEQGSRRANLSDRCARPRVEVDRAGSVETLVSHSGSAGPRTDDLRQADPSTDCRPADLHDGPSRRWKWTVSIGTPLHFTLYSPPPPESNVRAPCAFQYRIVSHHRSSMSTPPEY